MWDLNFFTILIENFFISLDESRYSMAHIISLSLDEKRSKGGNTNQADIITSNS
jgi:hypothetical protein